MSEFWQVATPIIGILIPLVASSGIWSNATRMRRRIDSYTKLNSDVPLPPSVRRGLRNSTVRDAAWLAAIRLVRYPSRALTVAVTSVLLGLLLFLYPAYPGAVGKPTNLIFGTSLLGFMFYLFGCGSGGVVIGRTYNWRIRQHLAMLRGRPSGSFSLEIVGIGQRQQLRKDAKRESRLRSARGVPDPFQ